MESFFSTMKEELAVKIFKTKANARKEIFEYVEAWYNTRRLHSSLGFLSPIEYEIKNCLVA
jgi:transposase InsO family protein